MSPQRRPNVLIYVSHDSGRHIGPYGVATVHTPHAERLAREGAVFESAFCTAPQCSPSRASLFTGRYPHATGVLGLTQPPFLWDLHPDEVHAAAHFAALGYETLLIGIAHETHSIPRLGYQFVSSEQRAAHVAAELAQWLSERGDSALPFFAAVGVFETHRPFDRYGAEPDQSLGLTIPPFLRDTPGTRTDCAALQGMFRAWDEGLGNLLQVLDDRGLSDDTLMVVTADHGLALPRAKCTLYDPGLEIMLMLRWPDRLRAGQRFRELVSNVDVLPTLLEAAGGQVPDRLQGRSFWPLLQGERWTPGDAVFAEKTYHSFYDPMRCARTRRYKYIRNFEAGPGVEVPGDVILGPSYRDNIQARLTPRHHPPEELYDLKADPHECENMIDAPAVADVRAELRAALSRWMQETGDPLLQGPISSPTYRAAIEGLRQA